MRRHQPLIDQMTLEEKASLLSGANFWNTKAIERLGVPSIMLTDGPHGLRKQGGKADHLGLNASIPATCFPAAGTLANSWDVSLIREVGEYIGHEAAAEQVSVLLGPGLNIIRNPLGGRSFEYYSEDPFLTGHLAAAMVQGIQKNGIAASPKHFAVNSQEHLRMSIDEIVDERSLREIYLEGFRHVVEASQPKTIMSSYNRVNGAYTNESTHLLNTILKKEWGFDGVVVTDWGGENDRVAGLLAGNQLEMPASGGITDAEVVAAVTAGTLAESVLDTAVDNLLELTLTTKSALEMRTPVDFDAHHEKAIDAARRSIVLLKNEAILPLAAKTRVAVIGDFAKTPRYQGAGSSLVNPTRLDSALQALEESSLEVVGFARGFKRAGGRNAQLRNEAVRVARSAEVVLLFLGLDESLEAEGADRQDMHLSAAQLEVARAVIALGKKIVVVLAGGAPIGVPFAQDVPAILHGFLAGQGGGQAIVDVITGAVNPSGKLAVTYPLAYKDVPSALYYPGKEATSEHREALFVGYRYYDTKNVPVLFPFGHGLSYASFEHSDLRVSERHISWTIENTGKVAGAEIGQIYIGLDTSAVFRAKRELKGFVKVVLQPGESQRVTVTLDDHAFSYYNIVEKRWVIEPGEYTVEVSASIQDVRLSDHVVLKGEKVASPYDLDVITAYRSADVQGITSDLFAKLVGRALPSARWDRSRALTVADTIAQLHYTNIIGRAFRGIILFIQRILFLINQPIAANNVEFIISLPFSKIERFTGGKVSRRAVERFLRLVNK